MWMVVMEAPISTTASVSQLRIPQKHKDDFSEATNLLRAQREKFCPSLLLNQRSVTIKSHRSSVVSQGMP